MEKHYAVYAAETIKGINSLVEGAITGILLPEGLSCFAFRRLSEKQKKPKTLRPRCLCGK